MTILSNPGDSNANLGQVQIINAGVTTSQFTIVALSITAGGIASNTLRVTWIAIGW